MKITLTDDEARAVGVAIRMTSAAHTELLSMSPSKEIRHMLTDSITRLASAGRKLEMVETP